MKAINISSKLLLVKGIFMILIGVFHILAIAIWNDKLFDNPIPELIKTEFYVWFILSGVLFAFIGFIDVLCYSPLKKSSYFAWKLAFASSLLAFLVGLFGIIIFGEGPPFLIFAFSLPVAIVLVINRKYFSIV